jgi:hypothetical protein
VDGHNHGHNGKEEAAWMVMTVASGTGRRIRAAAARNDGCDGSWKRPRRPRTAAAAIREMAAADRGVDGVTGNDVRGQVGRGMGWGEELLGENRMLVTVTSIANRSIFHTTEWWYGLL